jgi:hypothetical protein
MNIPFLQDTTFTGLISTGNYGTSQDWSDTYTIVQSSSADWNSASGRVWGSITGVLSAQTDLWSELKASDVKSVNGKTGDVVLSAEDVGALQTDFNFETFIYDGQGLTTINEYTSLTGTMTLPAQRNTHWNVDFSVTGSTRILLFPVDAQVGDRIRVAVTAPSNTTVVVYVPYPGPNSKVIATLTSGQRLAYSAQVTRFVPGGPLGRFPIWEPYTEIHTNFGAVPTSITSPGETGTFVFADRHMYICIAPNTWRRVTVAAF